jgi:predicted nucleotidyltransferase
VARTATLLNLAAMAAGGTQKMVADKELDELVSRMQKAAGGNLASVVLYGSAAAGDFNPEFSNLNLLCVLRDTTFAQLSAIAPVVAWWRRQKQPAPLLMTWEEVERSTDVFSIELLDMQRHHRILFGEDRLSGLRIPMHLHRTQVEYELREKTILLRQRLLEHAGNDHDLWNLLLGSFPAFATLFRHALIALGDASYRSKREAIQALGTRIQFDGSALVQLLDVRERKLDRKQCDVKDVFARYLVAVEQVTAAVDTMLDAPGPA